MSIYKISTSFNTRSSPPKRPPETSTIFDSGASNSFATTNTPCTNEQPLANGPPVLMADNHVAPTTATANLPFTHLPNAATECHIVPQLRTSLTSVGNVCDSNMTAIFDATSVKVYKTSDIADSLRLLQPTPPMIEGTRNPQGERLYRIPFPTPPLQINSAYMRQTKQQLVQFLHATAGSPVPSTWIKAIKQGFFATWPGLTAELVAKHLPPSAATMKGHLDHERQNIRSTKAGTETPTDPAPPPVGFTDDTPHQVFLTIFDCKGEIATDQTGPFPIKSNKGNRYLMVLYAYDPNAILVEPLKSRKGAELLRAYKKLTTRLTERGFRPKFQRLDNEASKEMKKYMKLSDVDYQLAPPHSHRRNSAERTIRTFKNHFISILCGTDEDFPLQCWDELVEQAELTINLLRASRINPKLSAWHQVEGIFDYNRTPMAPPGIKVVVHETSQQRNSWSTHGLDGFYVGPALEHYRCYRSYLPSTNGTRTAGTTVFLPGKYTMPHVSPADKILEAARELTHALQDPQPAGPIQFSDPHLDALRQLANIFNRAIPTDPLPATPVPPPRVTETTPTLPATPPRVVETPPTDVSNAPSIPRVSNQPMISTITPVTPPRRPRTPPVVTPPSTARIPVNMPHHLPTHRYNTRHNKMNHNSANYLATRSWTHGALRALLMHEWHTFETQIVQPMTAQHVIDEKTGAILQYKDIMKRDDLREIWIRSFANEIGRLAQGVGNRLEGTNTIFFIHHHQLPKGRKPTYGRIVCDIRPHKTEPERTRLTVGGNLIDYPGDVSAKVADITTAKMLFNSVISTPNAKFMGIDIKNFYLGTPMERYEYMFLPIEVIPQEIIDEYQLMDKVHNGKVYMEIRRGMYGLPQSGMIAQKLLTKRLAKHGYRPCRHTPGLWKHDTRPVHFTLVVDDFGVKYVGREHAEHLVHCLSQEYPITTDWEGNLFCGITLQWDYKNRTVQLSIPGYVEAALHEFQHPKPSRPHHAPSHWIRPEYGKQTQTTTIDHTAPMTTTEIKLLQKVVGKFLFYARAVDPTMLHLLNHIASAQSNGTQATMQAMTYFLNYCATHPDATLTFTASDMILHIHSDASYLSESKARSRVGGHFYLGATPDQTNPTPNGPILAIAKIIRNVMSSAAEAEVGALFYNCKEAVPLRVALQEMGHPQPPTPVQVDNSTAVAIANRSCKQVRSKAIDMRFYWIQDRVDQEQFHVFWAPGTTNFGDFYTKHHPIHHHQKMRPAILNSGT